VASAGAFRDSVAASAVAFLPVAYPGEEGSLGADQDSAKILEAAFQLAAYPVAAVAAGRLPAAGHSDMPQHWGLEVFHA